MSSTELGHIADQLLITLDEMHSYTSNAWRTHRLSLQQPEHALPLEPSTRIFEHQGVSRLLPRHIPRILWARACKRVIQLPDGGTGLLDSQYSRLQIQYHSYHRLGDCRLLPPSSGSIAGCMILH